MKQLLIIAIAFVFAISAKAQSLSFQQQKDSAVKYYILIMDWNKDNRDTTMSHFNWLLDQYKVYRTGCLAHFKSKKDKDAFCNWVVAEYKKEAAPIGH
jgi:hypothetical protein